MNRVVGKISVFLFIVFILPCWSYASVWQVSKNNQQIFIGGTLHMLPESAFPLPDAFNFAYQASDKLVFETAIPEQDDVKFQQLLKQTITLAPEQQLTDLLSQETLVRLRSYLKKSGIKLAKIQHFKPGFIATFLTKISAQQANITGTGVDLYFEQRAKADNKAISYLEPVEFQLKLLAQMGRDNPDQFIQDSLNHLANFQTTFNQLLAAWQQGDSQALETLIIKPMKADNAKLFKLMMTDRNSQWLTTIEALFDNKQTEFVLVGVGHLVGQQSVLQLLASHGYQIRQLTAQ